MCIVQCLLHCWPHRGTSLCSCRCGFWLAALRSGDLQTKEPFRMCSYCERPCSVVYSRLHTEKLCYVWLLWGSKNVFVFIYSSCIWLDNTQAWSYRLFKRYQILNFRLKYLLSSVALDLRSPVGTHSVLRLVAGFRFLSSMHILEGMNPGKICSGAKLFRPSPRYLPPSISGVKVVLKETKTKRIRRHGQNHITMEQTDLFWTCNIY